MNLLSHSFRFPFVELLFGLLIQEFYTETCQEGTVTLFSFLQGLKHGIYE